MAKYIKLNLTDGEDLSIDINDIESVSYIDANTTQIDLNNGVSKFTITHGSALKATAVVEAIYLAMMSQTANVYSVVKGPISVSKVIDSNSGRQLITTKEKKVTFTSCVFSTSISGYYYNSDGIGLINLELDSEGLPILNNSNLRAAIKAYNIGELTDIELWDLSNVTSMENVFNGAPFIADISAWDVSNVTNMASAFIGNSHNPDISGWDVSSVTNMNNMFLYNQGFNQDISAWDVSSLTTMNSMFRSANKFNQDLSSWNVNSVVSSVNFDLGAADWTLPRPPLPS